MRSLLFTNIEKKERIQSIQNKNPKIRRYQNHAKFFLRFYINIYQNI